MYFNDQTTVYFDQQFMPANDCKVTVYAQALHYGYAVFEGIKSYNTAKGARIFKAEEHYERFILSAQKLSMPCDYDVDSLVKITYELLERNRLTDAYIRPLLFADIPNMGLALPERSCLFIAAWDWGTNYLGTTQKRLGISTICRPNPTAFDLEAKAAGHYVNSIMASAEARKRGFDEALLLDTNGYIAEGSGSNFFYEKDGQLYTSPKGSILPGITRSVVIQLAKQEGITVNETLFTPAQLEGLDGAFLTGTAAEVVGVASIDDYVCQKSYQDTIGYRLAARYSILVRES
jgi:branched-chain amino acid aminotransferase